MTGLLSLGRGRDVDGLTVFDEFTGFGGTLQGLLMVPGVVGSFAANHDPYVLAVSRHNYSWLEHFEGDVQRHDITKFRPAPCSPPPRPARSSLAPTASRATSTSPTRS